MRQGSAALRSGAPGQLPPPTPAPVTCPQGAVGPVEQEHRVAAQPPQRLLRRRPEVLEEAFLAVVVEQRLRERRAPLTAENASLRHGRRQSRPPRTGPAWPLALLPQAPPPPPAARRPPTRRPHTRGEARGWRARRQRPPVAPRRPSLLPGAAEGPPEGRWRARQHAAIGWPAAAPTAIGLEERRREKHGKKNLLQTPERV